MLEAREKTYTAKDFEYLPSTTQIDNEDGLEYRVVTVREHRARKGKYIVVDKELASGNGALDVAALTGTEEIRSPTLTAASEHTGRVDNVLLTHLQRSLLKAAETGDLHLVQELLRQGADSNAEELSNSRRRVLRESSDSSKKPCRAEDVRRSAYKNKTYQL